MLEASTSYFQSRILIDERQLTLREHREKRLTKEALASIKRDEQVQKDTKKAESKRLRVEVAFKVAGTDGLSESLQANAEEVIRKVLAGEEL